MAATAFVCSMLLFVAASAGISFGASADGDRTAISSDSARQFKALDALNGDADAYDIASMAIPAASNIESLNGSYGRVAALPGSLAELALPEGSAPYLIDAGECTVEYETSENASDALTSISKSMESSGWRKTGLGGLSGATFIKESGSIRWALVTSTEKSLVAAGPANSTESCVLVRVMNRG